MTDPVQRAVSENTQRDRHYTDIIDAYIRTWPLPGGTVVDPSSLQALVVPLGVCISAFNVSAYVQLSLIRNRILINFILIGVIFIVIIVIIIIIITNIIPIIIIIIKIVITIIIIIIIIFIIIIINLI